VRERERERERKKERERDGFFEIGSLSYLPRLGSNCDPFFLSYLIFDFQQFHLDLLDAVAHGYNSSNSGVHQEDEVQGQPGQKS
jgi:hypothetical protein